MGEAVLKWILLVCDANVPLSGTLIKGKAVEYAKSMDFVEFDASSGWLDKFKECQGIKESVCRESADEMDEDCDQWKHGALKFFWKLYS